jgi:sugar phosphate isomerase/epimerase
VIARRTFLAAAFASPRPKLEGLKIGVMAGSLGMREEPVAAIQTARGLGFDGVELIIGMAGADNRMFLDNPALQAQCVAEARRHRMPLSATVLNILHSEHLKNQEIARKRVIDGIEITRRLGAKIMLIPFFNQAAPQTEEEKDHLATIVKDIVRHAETAGVVLGFENTLSAEDNARILDRVASGAFKVFYDVGNLTRAGYDVLKEIRWLGRERICQFHLKDEGYLGEGKIDFRKVLAAIDAIGFTGYANFETRSPSNNVEADMRRNLAFIRGLIVEMRA